MAQSRNTKKVLKGTNLYTHHHANLSFSSRAICKENLKNLIGKCIRLRKLIQLCALHSDAHISFSKS